MRSPGLVRAIGRYDLTAAIVNAVVGSAIFGLPARIAELTGVYSPLAYLYAGLGMLFVVLCFAEVASRFHDAGGPYLYVRHAFGGFAGFQAGWLTFWIRVTSVAANINVLADYLAKVVPAAEPPNGRTLAILLVLGVITVVNVVGVRQATWTVDVLTAAKLVPLVVLIALGLPLVRMQVLQSQAASGSDWPQAILLLVYAYGGFEAPLIPAGETRDPKRDTAFALIVALLVIATLYMLVQLVVAGVVPHVAAQKAPVAAAFERLMGPTGVLVASFAAVLSISAWATGSVLQSPRVLFSMAERGELPALFARVHPAFRTPHLAIVTYSVLAFVLAVYGSFQWNATLSAVVRLVTYGLTCAALPLFRRRPGFPEAGFRVPLAELVVPVSLALALWLLYSGPSAHLQVLLALMAIGAALYLAAGRRRIESS